MKNTIGISFSKNNCYLTQLTQKNEKLSLVGVTSFGYEHDLLNALSANADIVKSLITNSTRVILALPSHEALLKNITVDSALSDNEIICHIHSQSLMLFGHTPEQLCLDYETRAIEENSRHIVVVACHQQKISAFQRCFAQLKISLDVIDIDVFSLLRLMVFLKDELIDLSSPAALALIPLNDDNMMNPTHDLKNNVEQLGFSYETLMTAFPFNSPFLISIGAGLWRES